MHLSRQVVAGQTTETFRRHPMPSLARASFSLVYADTEAGGLRTLDLICLSGLEHELWFWGLHVGAGIAVVQLNLCTMNYVYVRSGYYLVHIPHRCRCIAPGHPPAVGVPPRTVHAASTGQQEHACCGL